MLPRSDLGHKDNAAQKRQNPPRVSYWEIIADNLSKAGWSWGCISAILTPRYWAQVGARAIPATRYPCRVASKDRRPGFCPPLNSFEQRLLCKAQNVYLRGRHENLMPKTLLRLWTPTMVAQR